ncbi:MAG: type VI secretion system protein ImpL [Paraglaciecola sp.]|jgi:type VI secretion system protein ImpL
MNFSEIKRSLHQLLPFAEQYNLVWLLVIAVILIIVIVIVTGKVFKFRIPFLPRSLAAFSLSKDNFSALSDKLKSSKQNTEESNKPEATEKTTGLADLFRSINLLTGKASKRYDVPTYLLLSDDPHTSTILNAIESGNRENLLLQEHKIAKNKHWFIYDSGCVISHPEPLKMVSQLKQHRPERPIDGVLIFLSCDIIAGDITTELQAKADDLYKKLWRIQNQVEFILPVYVVLTQSETLTGFTGFWQQKGLSKFSDNILGWSNPNNEDTPYSHLWVEQAIGYISQQIRKAQLAVFKNKEPKTDGDSIFLLPSAIEKLSPGLRKVLNTLFGKSHYNTSFMFRGVYLCGSEVDTGKQLFLSDLLEKKVFAEVNLAYAPKMKLLSSNRTRRFFQTLLLIFTFTYGLGFVWYITGLDERVDALSSAIKTVPNPTQGDNLTGVNRVLEHISTMDARSLESWTIPSFYITKTDNNFKNYFNYNIFTEKVFPAFQCRSHLLIHQQRQRLSELPQGDLFQYYNWLQGMTRQLSIQTTLDNLIEESNLPHQEVLATLNNLVGDLYDSALPASFAERSELYIEAIALKSNKRPKNKENPYCQEDLVDNQVLWQAVLNNVEQQKRLIARQVAAPVKFFEVLANTNNASSGVLSKDVLTDFKVKRKSYVSWLAHLQSKWINSNQNICLDIQQELIKIASSTGNSKEKIVTNFAQSCQKIAYDVMRCDNGEVLADSYAQDSSKVTACSSASMKLFGFQLYQIDDNNQTVRFTEKANALFSAVNEIGQLSYLDTVSSEQLSHSSNSFYWSIPLLNQALAAYQEYQSFAELEYATNWLGDSPESTPKYLAQATALSQLQAAMSSLISSARVQKISQFKPDTLRPIDQKEANLAAKINNFRQAMYLLIDLSRGMELLNFNETKIEFLNITRQHAYHLLGQVNQLYLANRLYQPKSAPNWTANQYLNALFGISGDGQLTDFLATQSQRTYQIATQYAEPLVTYLLNTKGTLPDYNLFTKWQNSLVELHKQQSANPANSQAELESFFQNQLVNIEQSNCFDQISNLTTPQQNDLFADSQLAVIRKAKSHCEGFRADNIVKEYQQLVSAFNRLLANKYPFSNRGYAPNVTTLELKAFLKIYQGENTGLAQKLKVLAKNKDYQHYISVYPKIKALDKALTFFATTLGTGEAAKSSPISISIELNVQPKKAKGANHISQWSFSSAENTLVYPGTGNNISWLPNQPVSLTLNWAQNSMYQATAINGNPAANNRLLYSNNNPWSLLSFINQHRAQTEDRQAQSDASVLLQFSALVSKKYKSTETNSEFAECQSQAKQRQPCSKVYARITLFGLDPVTQQLAVLPVPVVFPSNINLEKTVK